MPGNPTVSAIILNYRTSQETLRCVEAIRKQTMGDAIEIIVVDNASADGSGEKLRGHLGSSNVRLIELSRNVGYGQGNNAGIAAAHGTYVLIVNPDTTLERDAAERMVRFLDAHPETGIIGPQLRLPDGSIRDSFRTFPTLLDLCIKRTALHFFFPGRMRRYLQWDASPHETRAVDWVVGACMMLRRSFFQELGGFDPRFFLFFEDTDLCRRSWTAGKQVVYFPEARAKDSAHRLSSGSFIALFTKSIVRIHLRSAIRYFRKWETRKAEKAEK